MTGRSAVAIRSLRVILFACALGVPGCASALPDQARVARAIDGDTVELADGRLVRYLGIDAPEVRRREGGRWIEDPEPFGREAAQANRDLVEGRRVRLEYDMATRDRFGRVLAYVYVGPLMVNEALLREGLARPLAIPPNLRYAVRFAALAEGARRKQLGLWSGEPAEAGMTVTSDQ